MKDFSTGTRGKHRIGILLLFFILCAGILAGCARKDTERTNQRENEAVSPTVSTDPVKTTPTATPSPTPTPIPFVKQTYETYGRDDVYRIPVAEFEEDREIMSANFAGDYALLWTTPMGLENGENKPDICILLKPGVSTEQYRINVDYYIREQTVLADGTVIISEWDTDLIHVYDNKMNEIRSFVPGKEGASQPIGYRDDGIVWTVDEENAKILATDLTGKIAEEYPYDAKYQIIQYLGVRDGKECFDTVYNDGNYVHRYMYLSTDSGRIIFRDVFDPELGDDWPDDTLPYTEEYEYLEADATWFFQIPGYARRAFVFPKSARKEDFGFLQDKKLCGCCYSHREDNSVIQEFRLYDLENRRVSEPLRDTDIPDCYYLTAKGVLDDGYVMLLANKEDGARNLLLWDAAEKTSPIEGFCDFEKEDAADCLKRQLAQLKDRYGIVITPDCEEGETGSLGDIILSMDFANSFMLDAKADPEVLKAGSGETVHPENMRNNEGAHYTFNPHVFSGFYLKEHGEARRDAFFAYVDALREGEDGFKCPDTGSAEWASGRLAQYFFPIGAVYADAEYTGNGWAEITYLIPKEEFLEKERDFEARICGIVNDVVEEDYTDLEKALALYEFMTEYCTYDYEMLEHLSDWMDKQSGYRCLIEKKAICWEIACLYRYLLLQCGVDAEESTGQPFDPEEDLHEWNYIELDGQGYLIDATWGLSRDREPELAYFLFTDEMRDTRDGFDTESFDIGGYGLYGARSVYSFEADDDRYSELWEGKYVAFDQEKKCIFYRDTNGAMHRFDYGEK